MIELQNGVVGIQAGVGQNPLLFLHAQSTALFVSSKVSNDAFQARVRCVRPCLDIVSPGGFQPSDSSLDFQHSPLRSMDTVTVLPADVTPTHAQQLQRVLDRLATVAQDDIALLKAGG